VTLRVYQFPFDGSAEQVFFALAGRLGLPAGDCATEARAFGKWGIGGSNRGDRLCFQQDEPRSTVVWTYAAERIYANATRLDLDRQALHDWWLTVAPFID
jgi:hypothetical protein